MTGTKLLYAREYHGARIHYGLESPFRWSGGRRPGGDWWVHYGPVGVAYLVQPDMSDPIGMRTVLALRLLWWGITFWWDDRR